MACSGRRRGLSQPRESKYQIKSFRRSSDPNGASCTCFDPRARYRTGIVTHHTALQPNLYCGPHCEGNKVKALDPLQAPMCTCSSPSIKQRCCSTRSNNILPEIGECLSLPHFLRITQVLGHCSPLFSPTLHVTLPTYQSDFPSCASRSYVISPARIEQAFPSLWGAINGSLNEKDIPFLIKEGESFTVLLFCSSPAPARANKAFSRLNQSLGYTFLKRIEGKAWAALSSRACVLGSFCIIGSHSLAVLVAMPWHGSTIVGMPCLGQFSTPLVLHRGQSHPTPEPGGAMGSKSEGAVKKAIEDCFSKQGSTLTGNVIRHFLIHEFK
eukprot:Gb_31419 [translate_table: standard]